MGAANDTRMGFPPSRVYTTLHRQARECATLASRTRGGFLRHSSSPDAGQRIAGNPIRQHNRIMCAPGRGRDVCS